MSIELRDYFAAHAAGALLSHEDRADEIARRAYDVAESLLTERERRLEREAVEAEEPSLAERAAGPAWAGPPADFERASLLDEPAPMSDRDVDADGEIDPAWEDRAFDPRWEREPRWAESDAPSSERPGLRSTRPPVLDDKRHRSA